MNKFDGSLFPCPACGGNCYPPHASSTFDAITTLRCSKCNEDWNPLYIRGFMAGYAKKEKEINE